MNDKEKLKYWQDASENYYGLIHGLYCMLHVEYYKRKIHGGK